MAKGIIELSVGIEAAASVVGKNEYKGPLGACFDMHDESDSFGAHVGKGRKRNAKAGACSRHEKIGAWRKGYRSAICRRPA